MQKVPIKIREQCDTKAVKDDLREALGAGLLKQDDYLVTSATLSAGNYVYEVTNPTPQPQDIRSVLLHPDVKSGLAEAVKDGLQVSNEAELTFSTCSDRKLKNYLTGLHVGFELGDSSELPTTDIEFIAFQWIDSEEEDIPRAKLHLENELKKFGIQLGRGNYQLYDVHANKTILSVEDRKTGKLNGGTDLIIGPFGLHQIGLVQQSCVVVELKTSEDVKKYGLSYFTTEATLELIASNYFSNQMTVVLLTDLCSGATLFTLNRDQNDSVSIVIYENLTISQGAKFIADHIAEDCVPQKAHKLELGEKDADFILRAFKKSRVSPLEDSVQWEQFQDMLQDSAPGSWERAEVINQLYRSCDFPQPAYLNLRFETPVSLAPKSSWLLASIYPAAHDLPLPTTTTTTTTHMSYPHSYHPQQLHSSTTVKYTRLYPPIIPHYYPRSRGNQPPITTVHLLFHRHRHIHS